MLIELHGAGRAGGALAIAASRAGHAITSIESRDVSSVQRLADMVDVVGGMPDLRVIAVSDSAIRDVAGPLADRPPVPTVHLSGAVPVDALAPLEAAGALVGSFHPLQTLPDAVTGADRLPGAWIAVTAPEPLRTVLRDLATSLGCTPFDLDDAVKATYHAGAAAAANFTLTALGVAERLFAEAGVPFAAARPLVEAVVANGFNLGPSAALTGPIARGDASTVRAQLDAVAALDDVAPIFVDLARATARFATATDEVRGTIG
jgi:predicted short-subunit dehydrogenase-like oxidoreductase (DUF2520 family)